MVENRDRDPEQAEGEEFRESLAATRGRGFTLASPWASTAGVLMVAAGVWLIVAPFVLSYGGGTTQLWNDIILGVIVGLVGLSAFTAPRTSGWINLLAGIWLIIAPFVLSYQGGSAVGAAWNDVVLGIIVGVLGLWSMAAPEDEVV